MQNNYEKYVNPLELARERVDELTAALKELESAINPVNKAIDTFVESSVQNEQHFKALSTVTPEPHRVFNEHHAHETPEVSTDNNTVIDLDTIRQQVMNATDEQQSFEQMIMDANSKDIPRAA